MIDKIKQYLETRIAELNKADADFCKDRWDMTKPKMERDLYRGFSNEVTFARQELERTLKFLNELSKGAVISSFCQCEKPDWCMESNDCGECGKEIQIKRQNDL